MKHDEALKGFTFEIAPADIDDLPEILKLQYLAYQSEAELLGNPNIPPLQQTLSELQEEFRAGTVLKAVDTQGVIIGSVRFRQAAQTVYVGKLIVLPELQRRSIGTRLLTEVEQRCPGMRLELFTSSRSIRNIALYGRCGYRKFNEKIISDKLTFVYLEKLPGNFIPEADCPAYLQADACVDFHHPAIAGKAKELFAGCRDETTAVQIAFDFVCNRIAHSADINSTRISRTASEVLLNGEGICYAKSMLLAALLRYHGIPTGFCYQQLRLDGTPNTPLVIHALNAVRLASRQGWTRIDARGNTNGIDAKFIPGEEHLAFPVRPEYGESEYPTIYVAPHSTTVKTLNNFTNCREMFKYLPESL